MKNKNNGFWIEENEAWNSELSEGNPTGPWETILVCDPDHYGSLFQSVHSNKDIIPLYEEDICRYISRRVDRPRRVSVGAIRTEATSLTKSIFISLVIC